MTKVESVFAPHEDKIRIEIQRIQQEGEAALIDPTLSYYDSSEYGEDYYQDVLNFLQATELNTVLDQINEVGSDPLFRSFIDNAELQWEDVETELDKRYSAVMTELVLFLATFLDFFTVYSLTFPLILPDPPSFSAN